MLVSRAKHVMADMEKRKRRQRDISVDKTVFIVIG